MDFIAGTLKNNQQTLCTLTTFESSYQIKHKGREQNCSRTGDVTLFQETASWPIWGLHVPRNSKALIKEVLTP